MTMTTKQLEALVMQATKRGLKLTKRQLFSVPYGVAIVTNTIAAKVGDYMQITFCEKVAPLDDREYQWERIKQAGAAGKTFSVVPAEALDEIESRVVKS